MTDPYQVLGVSRTASQDDIKKAYRKLARTLHPDLNPGDAKAEDRFKLVSAAYDLLSDPAKKARFDRGEIDASGQERPRSYGYQSYSDAAGRSRGGGGGAGGFHFNDDPEDILSELLRRRDKGRSGFGGFGFGFGGGEDKRKGADANFTLRVTLNEAASGTTKRITLPSGKTGDVKVPPGTADGAILRLKGQGNPGTGGGPNGDALIEIRVEDDQLFKRDGNDLRLDVPVTLQEAILGAKITVPTLDGKVAVTVPPNSNSGTVLRLKGKGVPSGKGANGDLFVTLQVTLPDRPDPELEAFVKKWGANYNPRGKLGV